MILDASKFIPGNAKDKLPEFDDRCIDLVVTAPPGFTERGKKRYTALPIHGIRLMTIRYFSGVGVRS